MGASVIIAAMRMREEEVIRDLRAAGATSPAAARTVGDLGLEDSRAINRLRNQAIVREAAPGKLYLDEEVLSATRRRRFRILWMLIVILVLVLVAMRLGLITS
jgi:hypothetical protein